jgi:hypothetical protein
MFFVFGWGRTTQKNVTNVAVLHCAHCNNVGPWHALRRKTWFTLFFIPVIPYKTYAFLHCGVCSRGWELTGDEFAKAVRLADLSYEYTEKKTLTRERYQLAFNEVGLRDLHFDIKAIPAPPPETDGGDQSADSLPQ